MDTRESYNLWAAQYDTNQNKTRDLEAQALRELLAPIPFQSCLEIGCGTGKNTVWLAERALAVTAVDLSEEMLAVAREKVRNPEVEFIQADIIEDWTFCQTACDLVSFSLVLEHIKDLDPVFHKAAKALKHGGWLYVGELHPFKQYGGSKARFETETGTQIVNCYNHHISDFVRAASQSGMRIHELREYFDGETTGEIPRILAMIFVKE